MSDTVGTIRKAQLNGISFPIPADVDATIDLDRFANDSLPTSGKNVKQMVLKTQVISGLTLRVNLSKYKQLKTMSESIDAIPATLELANGDKVIGEGDLIGDRNFTTAEGVYTFDFAFSSEPILIIR